MIPNSLYEQASERILDQTVQIQQVPAPTFDEKLRSDYVAQLFARAGLDRVEQDDLHNVYARIPGGSARPLVITAHLDTVFSRDTDLSIRREANRIYGPGIGDNSLGVAVLAGIKEMVDDFDTPLAGDIILAANVCEEGLGDLAGIKGVVERIGPETPMAYLVLEGVGIDRIYVRGVGSVRYRITASTRGGHSWSDFGQASAIHELVCLGADLAAISLPQTPKTTLNIGVIQGGRSVNTIADRAEMLLDLRSVCPDSLSGLAARVETIIQSRNSETAALKHEIIGSRPAGGMDRDAPLIRLCQKAHKAVRGGTLALKDGSTDANIPFSLGIPAVCLSLTTGGNVHLESEYIDTAPLAQGLEILAQVLQGIWAASEI